MAPAPSTPRLSRSARIVRWLPLLTWAVVIFSFSSLPGSRVPGHFSFEAHFLEYAVFGALATLAIRPRPATARAALLALALCSLYAVSDEFHQSFVPGRVPDVADWAMDTLGAGVGIAAAVLVLARRRVRESH